MPLRFCPLCGTKLPQSEKISYCPSCGENLKSFAVKKESGQTGEGKAGVAAVVGRNAPADTAYSGDVAADPKQGVNKAEIRPKSGGVFSNGVMQMPVGGVKRFSREVLPAEASDGCLSVVLKTTGNKERLIARLSAVLRRSTVAIRMAVDMTPGVIVYKAKAGEVKAVTEIFDEEGLHYAVLAGDFRTLPVEEVIPKFFGLPVKHQQMLRNAPTALWLGERVRRVSQPVELGEEPGLLVLSDRALYFAGFSDDKTAVWRIVPISRLYDVVLHEGDGMLELINREFMREALLRIPDGVSLGQVYDYLRFALNK